MYINARPDREGTAQMNEGKAASTPTDASDPIVNLGYATYAGSINHSTGHTQFLVMRYAAPPTGQGEQAKTPFRMMGLNKRDPFSPSEDCLFLNVYTPADMSNIKKKLPVVVFIHGGGSGFNWMDVYDGNDLILEANQGVVAVVIQYRLGVFGFLPGSEVKRNGVLNAGLHVSANFREVDQHFALRWITKFGGDPTRVTIWGQSAVKRGPQSARTPEDHITPHTYIVVLTVPRFFYVPDRYVRRINLAPYCAKIITAAEEPDPMVLLRSPRGLRGRTYWIFKSQIARSEYLRKRGADAEKGLDEIRGGSVWVRESALLKMNQAQPHNHVLRERTDQRQITPMFSGDSPK
ncbi:Alpha/Beta hydrolase protein [Collybia nuda]|uniref:Alpha/Beta hydrolase protein n=1 Tax=Collybia nuda TaxID=64659 RepID=A0A9P5Y5Q9_9AGAR|nr:Alpha/Beta hydrolase protein [Collybia nuda]